MTGKRNIVVTSSLAGIERGSVLSIGSGEHRDLVLVRSVRARHMTVVQVRWWHRAQWAFRNLARRMRGRALRAWDWLVTRLCARRGHLLARHGKPDRDGNVLHCCRCGQRHEYMSASG